MVKIKNWTRINEGDINYDEKFDNSRFDREVKPIVWKFEGKEDLFYVVYKNHQGYYLSEYVGLDSQDVLDPIGSVEDVKTITSKQEAHTIASDILEDNTYPFGNYDRNRLKDRTREVLKNMYSVHYGTEKPSVRIKSLQGRSSYAAKLRGGLPLVLWVDWGGFEIKNDEQRMSTLIHELSHDKYGHHKPSFWRNVFDIYHNIEGYVNFHPSREVDWEEVARYIVKDIHKGNLDMRTTTVGEMRKEAEEELGVKVDDHYPRNKYKSYIKNKTMVKDESNWRKTYEEIEIKDYNPEELWNFIKSNYHQAEVFGNRKYMIPPPELYEDTLEPVSEKDSKLLTIIDIRSDSENQKYPFIPK